MQSVSAKSGKYRYYDCYECLTKGVDQCSSKPLPQTMTEDLVLKRIADFIVTEDNLTRLIQMVNEEVLRSQESKETETHVVSAQLTDRRHRLNRLYESLETGALELADLAPRIKRLRQEIEQLEQTKLRLWLLPRYRAQL